ncbi:hypothetical protein [Pararhodobacter sp.]|uniref:hypothetical protein n=1 Tax=Pararhodobacter sp. TaxID=2127056 RepID=UPI002AFEB628|nr:hypothetical protein [Pararhodobacter sp.]
MADAVTESVFLPYQSRLSRAVDAHAVTVVEKSRRTGYSWAASFIATLKAGAAKASGGSDVFYIGYNLEMAREFIDYVAAASRSFAIASSVREDLFRDPDNPDRDVKVFRIDYASGHKVLALPSVPRALRGMQGLVIIDEAAFHDDLDELLKAAFALLIWGGKVLVISTHDGAENPFNELVEDIRAGRKPYHLERCTFDDALADGLYRRICRAQGKVWSPEAEAKWRADIIAQYGEAADEELFCIPRQSGGAAIPGTLVEARMLATSPVLRFSCPDDFVHRPERDREEAALRWCEDHLAPELARLDQMDRHAVGVDFGRSGDLSVFWPLAIQQGLQRHTPFIIELRNVPFRQQEQILFYLCDRLPRFEAGKLDARGNGQYLAEVAAQRYGSRIEQVMLSEGWYRENMPPMKAMIEDASITLPKDRDVHGDFRALTIVRGVIRVPERTTGKDGGQRHGDSAIACALAVAASRAEVTEYGYRAVTTARANNDYGAGNGWARPNHAGDTDGRGMAHAGRHIRGAL